MIVVEFDNYFQEQRFQSQTKLQYPALCIGLLSESKYQDLNVSKWNVYFDYCVCIMQGSD